ncbi:MAG TPA: pantoate--beta-alanine ligase, partial [Gammaproteobacteria bacterium]|nr:pantoate--beta-alanine ligase [Gammaproteobacteria bacterium]
GNLHAGHLSLLQRSKAETAVSLLSIFVNPTQFNQANDYVHYPRTLEADLALAEEAKVDYVLLPRYQDLYPDDYAYQLREVKFSEQLEGSYRPGHFSGVLTVVLKLLLLAQAKCAYFGEKDYQQVELVRGMVQAFFIPTEIISCPTIRNEFGLPLSSRNKRLTSEQYQQAQHFPALFHSKLFSCEEIKKQLQELGFAVDYIEEYDGRRFAAVKLGEVRLIDNIVVE